MQLQVAHRGDSLGRGGQSHPLQGWTSSGQLGLNWPRADTVGVSRAGCQHSLDGLQLGHPIEMLRIFVHQLTPSQFLPRGLYNGGSIFLIFLSKGH